jgi:hypothetical protein
LSDIFAALWSAQPIGTLAFNTFSIKQLRLLKSLASSIGTAVAQHPTLALHWGVEHEQP